MKPVRLAGFVPITLYGCRACCSSWIGPPFRGIWIFPVGVCITERGALRVLVTQCVRELAGYLSICRLGYRTDRLFGLSLTGGRLMPMHNPPHPGETLLMDVLPELGISVTELARHLGFARPHLSRVLHGHAPISPDLAVRLERAGIGKARMWLGVQTDYDLWQAEHREQPAIQPIAAHA